jgi:hypothetical protein
MRSRQDRSTRLSSGISIPSEKIGKLLGGKPGPLTRGSRLMPPPPPNPRVVLVGWSEGQGDLTENQKQRLQDLVRALERRPEDAGDEIRAFRKSLHAPLTSPLSEPLKRFEIDDEQAPPSGRSGG